MATSKPRSESHTNLVLEGDDNTAYDAATDSHGPSQESGSQGTQSTDIYPSLEMTSGRPTSHMFAAVLTCLALNVVFAPPAIICAIIARRAIRHNNLERAKQYSDAALAFSCFGLVSSFIAVVLVIVFVVIV